MQRTRWAALAAVVLAASVGVTVAAASTDDSSPPKIVASGPSSQYDLTGLDNATRSEAYIKAMDYAVALNYAKLAELDAARKRVVVRRAPRASGGPVSGACAAEAPPGFPGYIVQRESGGSPTATNPKSGAYGCAQILPSHFTSGSCRGMTYAQCWAALWANGAGASNWQLTR